MEIGHYGLKVEGGGNKTRPKVSQGSTKVKRFRSDMELCGAGSRGQIGRSGNEQLEHSLESVIMSILRPPRQKTRSEHFVSTKEILRLVFDRRMLYLR